MYCIQQLLLQQIQIQYLTLKHLANFQILKYLAAHNLIFNRELIFMNKLLHKLLLHICILLKILGYIRQNKKKGSTQNYVPNILRQDMMFLVFIFIHKTQLFITNLLLIRCLPRQQPVITRKC